MALSNSSSSDRNRKLRVFFMPFFASGHMIPMTDVARLVALRFPGEVEPTMVVTPANAALIAPSLRGSPGVLVLTYPFPSVGLPPGVENLSSAPAAETWRIYRAVDESRAVHADLLRRHRPDAVVADVAFWWTTALAAELGVPRLTFYPVGVFSQLALTNLFKIRARIMASDAQPVEVPDLPGPHRIRIPKSELPDFLVSDDHLTAAWPRIREAQERGYGCVVNTFYELEPDYCDRYRRTEAKRAYFVGPVALSLYGGGGGGSGSGSGSESAEERGGGGAGAREVVAWLDAREAGSVVFVCFGSWCHFSAAQLGELARGLELSGKAFLWAVREGGGAAEEWTAEEGWEERVRGRGMVLRGWAPQVTILGHPAVGAFLTHCGWNSVLEAAAAGVAVLTWPLVFEQFINERLVAEVVGFGEKVWGEGRRSAREVEVEGEGEVVPAEAIANAVTRFMEGEEWGQRTRRRAREVAEKAKAAVAQGGSSWRDLGRLIEDLLREWRGVEQEGAGNA
ncbi:UDP-glycosyltransferase 73B3 [Ananas comosus]|uniref:UDP-glycosyltransferase 73B3 n=1 Tax=Ananas comosus TaxID=4615 RepID=A0A199VFN7_ANACO|nr:UDP-glycosyltransferase 73B3 [Ananas comosus]